MESELERRIYEKAFALLKESTKIELPNENFRRYIHRIYSDRNFRINELKRIKFNKTEQYSIEIYQKQRLPLIPIHYWNTKVFYYYRVTRHDIVKDGVKLYKGWQSDLEKTFDKKYPKQFQ
jgi:hypothetical protein